ncbi:MAG: hypothetical protein COA42_01790, partial [Alteromonadaceae bacterium]
MVSDILAMISYLKRHTRHILSIVTYVTPLPLACVLALISSTQVIADQKMAYQQAEDILNYGTILYPFYQRDYFTALVNHSYVSAQDNIQAQGDQGQVLKGGMLLNYAMPNDSSEIFSQLLEHTETELSRNAAWYYLAKLFYSKSNVTQARQSIQQIKGELPEDLHVQFHYLATLIHDDGEHLTSAQALDDIKEDLPTYPYFLFNIAVKNLSQGNVVLAKQQLEEVNKYASMGDEYQVLSDRAKHGLSQIATEQGQLQEAWGYLRNVRTTGLYSNRSLLSYSWAAINFKQYLSAIPALKILNQRSIALPEAQEGKVLLAHLYELEGSPRKALKQYINAEKKYREGIAMVETAREIIAMRDVPREFINNLENLIRKTDWYSEHPEVNYQNLTPFLLDLFASNNFNEILRELSDLYSIEKNLNYWVIQGEQHHFIFNSSKSKQLTKDTALHIKNSQLLRQKFKSTDKELRLLLLSLEEKDQDRFRPMLQSITHEITKLDRQSERISRIAEPYHAPEIFEDKITNTQKSVQKKLKETHTYIAKIENIVRKLV